MPGTHLAVHFRGVVTGAGLSQGGVVRQRTIADTISCTGVGLHNGQPVSMTLRPAAAGTGIVFVRSDLAHPVEIPVCSAAVWRTELSTKLGRGDAAVDTVEHLLAALCGLSIDNVRIEVDGEEVPGMDGSAASFVFLLRAAGIYEQTEPRTVYRLRRPLEIRDGKRSIRAEPSRSFKISYRVDYDHPAIGRQTIRNLLVNPFRFEREVARARTFGFLRDVEALHGEGRALGASLENTVVLDEAGVVNAEGLRCPDEFVRHKVLDLIGDLALLSVPLQAHVRVERGGHTLHQALVAELTQRIAAEQPELAAERPGLRPIPEFARS